MFIDVSQHSIGSAVLGINAINPAIAIFTIERPMSLVPRYLPTFVYDHNNHEVSNDLSLTIAPRIRFPVIFAKKRCSR